MKKDEVMLRLKLQFNLCIANKIKIGFSEGKKVYADKLQKRKKPYVHVVHIFCLFWKSNCLSSDEAIENMKSKTTEVDNRTSLDNIDSFFEYE